MVITNFRIRFLLVGFGSGRTIFRKNEKTRETEIPLLVSYRKNGVLKRTVYIICIPDKWGEKSGKKQIDDRVSYYKVYRSFRISENMRIRKISIWDYVKNVKYGGVLKSIIIYYMDLIEDEIFLGEKSKPIRETREAKQFNVFAQAFNPQYHIHDN